MAYRYLLTLLGMSFILTGFARGGWSWLLAWLGCDFLVLGVAHARKMHGVFGKRSDGTIPLWSWSLYLPLLACTLAVWHLTRVMSREPARTIITEQLVVGRRLIGSEVDKDFDNYVDLTAEFPEPPAARNATAYLCFPILDGGAPDPGALREVICNLRPGRTFVHCAQGHGRTGLFASAMLLSSAAVGTAEEALNLLRSLRPGIRLNRDQLDCVRACADHLAARAERSEPRQRVPAANVVASESQCS